jgi:hypothetical protein
MSHQSKLNVLLFFLYAVVVYGVGFLITLPFSGSSSGVKVTGVLLAGSLALGFAAQLIFDWNNTRTFGAVYYRACLVLIGLLVLVVVFNFETLICLVIGAPLLSGMMAAGLWALRFILSKLDGKSQLCLPLLALPIIVPFWDADALMPSKTYAVSTTIEMKGTPEDIRALAISVPQISDEERPWTFTHSILRAPRPLSATTIDGVRYASWERGVAFEEVLSKDTGAGDLAWRFNFPDPTLLKPLDYRVSPVGPEVFMETGAYHFEALGADRTLVTLTTTYRLQTPINGYLAFWGTFFLDDFHMAVLHVLAGRAEKV